MNRTAARDILRPFAWLAAIAFTVGFWSYLILGPGQAVARAVFPGDAARAPASMPASAPASADWNIAKHI